MNNLIFVLEDDVGIRRLVRYQLESAGFEVREYAAIRTLLEDAEHTPPVLFLLDVMVPDGNGFDLARRLQAHPDLGHLPIIFLTARSAENDRVKGLELGADDYISKPFATRELIARVKAVLRRFDAASELKRTSALVIGELKIDSTSMQLYVDGQHVNTTVTEFRLLNYLARHPGRVFNRDELLLAVWGDDRYVTPRSIDVYVRRLREKIEADPECPRYLKTLRGAGYRFDIPMDAAAEKAATRGE